MIYYATMIDSSGHWVDVYLKSDGTFVTYDTNHVKTENVDIKRV